MATETPELRSRKSVPFSLRLWLIGWGLVLAAVIALLAGGAALDTFAWRTTRWFMGDQDAYSWQQTKATHQGEPDAPFYYRVDPPVTRMGPDGQVQARLYNRTEKLWRIFRDLGEPYLTIILLATVWIYDRRRQWRAPVILLSATLVSGAVSSLLRMTAGRLRPNGLIVGLNPLQNQGENYWQLFRGFHTTADLSFPSGHATLAFTLAAALACLSPRGRWLFLILAALCALARVVMQAHFYSDVLAGAAIGYTLGWLTAVILDRLLPSSEPVTEPRR